MINFERVAFLLQETKGNTKDFVDGLQQLFLNAESDEISCIVNLISGRIGVSFAPRISWGERLSNDELVSRLGAKSRNQNIKPSDISVCELYNALHRINSVSARWYPKHGFGNDLPQLAKKMNYVELTWLINIIFGKDLPVEKDIIDCLELSISGGMGTRKIIKKIINQIVPDIGKVAETIMSYGFIEGATLLYVPNYGTPVPIESMKHHRQNELKAVLKRVKSDNVYVQAKSDGIFTQIHKYGTKIQVFTETEIISFEPMFKLINNLRTISNKDLILDCEVIGINKEETNVLPREKSLHSVKQQIRVFDIIKEGDNDYRHHTYENRRKRMIELFGEGEPSFAPGMFMVEEKSAKGYTEILTSFDHFVHQPRYEGVVIKSPNSHWSLKQGRFSPKRVKIKEYETLDMLLVGFFIKRSNIRPTSYLMAMRDNENTNLFHPCAIAVSKQGIRNKINQYCEKTKTDSPPSHIVPQGGPDFWTNGQMVVEVETDSLKDKDHEGLFPSVGWTLHNNRQRMMVFIREDKPIHKVNSINKLTSMNPSPGHSEL